MGKEYNRKYLITTVLTYFLLSFAWILYSDYLISLLTNDPEVLTEIQTYKGVFFVFVTSFILYILLKQYIAAINKEILTREKSEIQYKQLAEVASDLIYKYRLKPEPAFEFVSPSSIRITGYTPEEHYNDPLLGQKLIHPDDLSKLLQLLSNADFRKPYVLRWIKKDGTIIWTEQQNVPIYDDKNQLIALHGIARDITDRVLANQIIKESENRYRKLFEHHPYPMWIYDLEDLKFLDVNDVAIKKYGYSKQEFLNMTLLDIRPKEEREKLIENIKKHTEFSQSSNPWKHILKTGEIIFVEIISQELDFEGKAARLVVVNDVTQKIKTEHQLRLTKFGVDKSIIANYQISDSGQITFVNEYACKALGYTEEELLNMTVFDVDPEFPKERWFNFTKNLSEKGSDTIESLHKRKDGSTFPVEITINYLEFEGSRNIFAFAIDITERNKYYDQIQLQSSALNSAANAIVITDINGNIEWVNQAFTTLTGYSFEEAKGFNPRTLLKSDYQNESFYKELWDTILNGKVWRGELMNRRKDQTLYIEEQTITPVLNNKGFISHFIGIKTDVTEKKKNLEELIIAKENAEVSEKIKTEFLAQMSHEIRTPINAIVNYTSLLREECQLNLGEEFKFIFDGVETSTSRIIRTIDLILNMSELQTNSYQNNPVQINLFALAQNCVNEIKHLAVNKNLDLQIKCETENHTITADEFSTSQIIINLLDNAVKYTNEGFVEIKLTRNSDFEMMIEIHDSGIGISDDFKEKLFVPFAQEETGYTRKYDGNGLGLALVKKYCDLNNAEISFESKKDYGSTFIIVFKGNI